MDGQCAEGVGENLSIAADKRHFGARRKVFSGTPISQQERLAPTGPLRNPCVMKGIIVALASDGEHRFSKQPRSVLHLVAGLGVAGDAHAGSTVRHRSRVAKNPAAPNLRQLHLIHAELLDELAGKGFGVEPGQLGENVTTRGVDLLGLSAGTRLLLGPQALIEITGLRNPCLQIDQNIAPGAMAAMLDRREDGSLVRKAGVMAIVLKGGEVRAGDPVTMEWVPAHPVPLGPV